MPVFEGGCRVSQLKEGEPIRDGSLKVWRLFGRDVGAEAISLRILELDPGESASIASGDWDEALYVLGGSGAARLDGPRVPIAPDTAIYLRPGSSLSLENAGAGPLTIASSQCPDSSGRWPVVGGLPAVTQATGHRPQATFIRLEDRPIQRTGDRWYRELINDELGSPRMTQFVGSIPPGKAPDHFHLYEEVICILKGSGIFRAGGSSTLIGVGSCIFLPRMQPHCLENTGSDELRLLGVFYPAGSPTARYPASTS